MLLAGEVNTLAPFILTRAALGEMAQVSFAETLMLMCAD